MYFGKVGAILECAFPYSFDGLAERESANLACLKRAVAYCGDGTRIVQIYIEFPDDEIEVRRFADGNHAAVVGILDRVCYSEIRVCAERQNGNDNNDRSELFEKARRFAPASPFVVVLALATDRIMRELSIAYSFVVHLFDIRSVTHCLVKLVYLD